MLTIKNMKIWNRFVNEEEGLEKRNEKRKGLIEKKNMKTKKRRNLTRKSTNKSLNVNYLAKDPPEREKPAEKAQQRKAHPRKAHPKKAQPRNDLFDFNDFLFFYKFRNLQNI